MSIKMNQFILIKKSQMKLNNNLKIKKIKQSEEMNTVKPKKIRR